MGEVQLYQFVSKSVSKQITTAKFRLVNYKREKNANKRKTIMKSVSTDLRKAQFLVDELSDYMNDSYISNIVGMPTEYVKANTDMACWIAATKRLAMKAKLKWDKK